MKCAIKGTIRTGLPCTEEAVTHSPCSGSPICAACADEHDYLLRRLAEFKKKHGIKDNFSVPLINYSGRN